MNFIASKKVHNIDSIHHFMNDFDFDKHLISGTKHNTSDMERDVPTAKYVY